jgi:3-isopropylmalate dehydrogenase
VIKLEEDMPPVYERLTKVLPGYGSAFDAQGLHCVGVLSGEGVGPEVVPVALKLLGILQGHSHRRFDIRYGGPIGYPAKALWGKSLSPEVEAFAGEVFAQNGVLFCGPGGERFVYEMRQAFDLYCKFTPIQPLRELRQAGVVRSRALERTDIIAVRENSGGIYQGQWSVGHDGEGQRLASQSFSYTERMVKRILHAAFTLATHRRRRLHVVLKPGGVPSISELWQSCTQELSHAYDVEWFEQEVDNAVYQLIADPGQFDVIVSPNMFGDVLADCGSLLLGSRGLSFSGNFGKQGQAVYQTGHGAARDIAGKDLANPIGQILSLGMMLRESFCWPEADAALRRAVRATLSQGYVTADIRMPEYHVLGTQEFGDRVAEQLQRTLEHSAL